ncbi:MAG: ribonuclease Z, partial [Gemmatimonadetes bacterium]|nr:ribonuclease Z [Gemmatimonadota bacterium]
LVFSGDTRPCDSTVEVARGADLLIHEATFSDAEAGRARETRHSTATEAAMLARQAEVRKLVLTHFSARYSEQAYRLLKEAEVIYPALAAEDGLSLEVPLADEPVGEASD